MTIPEIDKILNEFEKIPKTLRQLTYLEICKYPYHRFEEVCSRLLCFYLSPQNEHGFQDLFLQSLLKLIAPAKTFYLQFEKVNVISEENAEGKRLDILIYSDKFAIGIENKITASLYNPLAIYKKRIEKYNKDNFFGIVLSLNKLSREEIAVVKTNEFIHLTYSDYFKSLKANISSFINSSNEKNLPFLNDFIKTIENMNNKETINKELTDYFYDNSKNIDQLIELYNQSNLQILEIQKEKIRELKDKISQLTNRDKWWAWQGWDLGYNSFNLNEPIIGIESYFEEIKGNPLGLFIIKITSWNLNAWSFYEQKLELEYPNSEIEKVDNRAFLFVSSFPGDNEELILENLKTNFDYLTSLTRNEA